MLKHTRAFLEKNEQPLRALAALFVAFASALWAITTLIYPDIIRPWLLPAKLEVEIKSHMVARNSRYSVHSVEFIAHNTGINKIYLHSNYFLARAYAISKHKKAKSEKNDIKHPSTPALGEFLASKSKGELEALNAEVSNYSFVKRWEALQTKHNLIRKTSLRSPFSLNKDTFQYIQIGKLTGLNEYLDPGDKEKSKILLIVPEGFQVLDIEYEAIVTKEKIEDYIFTARPHQDGLLLIPLKNSDNLDQQLQNFRDAVSSNIEGKVYEDMQTKLPESFFNYSQRAQIMIPKSDSIK